jgi:hypothetical protein
MVLCVWERTKTKLCDSFYHIKLCKTAAFGVKSKTGEKSLSLKICESSHIHTHNKATVTQLLNQLAGKFIVYHVYCHNL